MTPPTKKERIPSKGAQRLRTERGVSVTRNESSCEFEWATRYGCGVADSEAEAYYAAGQFDKQAKIKRDLTTLLGRFPQ